MIYVMSHLVETNFGPENEVTFYGQSWEVVFQLRECMSTRACINLFRREYPWHGEIRQLIYVGEILD